MISSAIYRKLIIFNTEIWNYTPIILIYTSISPCVRMVVSYVLVCVCVWAVAVLDKPHAHACTHTLNFLFSSSDFCIMMLNNSFVTLYLHFQANLTTLTQSRGSCTCRYACPVDNNSQCNII